MMKKIFLFSFLALNVVLLPAAEVDTFNQREEFLEDSSLILSTLASALMERVLHKVNRESSCQEEKLYKHIRAEFQNNLKGEFIQLLLHSPSVPRRNVLTTESIYRDLKITDSILINKATQWYKEALSPVLNVNGHLIGVDKFEHFLSRGHYYFQQTYVQKNSITKSLSYGQKTERGHLGGLFTGVMSFGDLAANFNGIRFWNDLLGKHDDILGKQYNRKPYIRCHDGKWIMNDAIDFTKYIDETWDEALNCSRFSAEGHIKNIEKQGFTCPIENLDLERLEKKYGSILPWIFNREGHGPLPPLLKTIL